MRSGMLHPGIFHTKSLTPGEKKLSLHQRMIDYGFLITSIDEEGGLVDYGYEKFANRRYSKKSIYQSSAVFSWGVDDFDSLNKFYPKYSSKIFKTGSPRADLWKNFFLDYWEAPKKKPKKPYLLVSSNMGLANNKKSFEMILEQHNNSGYYKRDPKMSVWHAGLFEEENRMIISFVNAIKYLADKNPDYDVVLRPHPVENIEIWKSYLANTPNVHVIQEGPISSWVNHAFAVMHNGCTTALEAIVSKKPLITFIPFKQKYERKLANNLGYQVRTNEELYKIVNNIFYKSNLESQDYDHKNYFINDVYRKIYIDKNELAAQKIIKVWEKLSKKKLNHPNNWKKFKLYLGFMDIRDAFVNLIKIFSTKPFGKFKENYKFPIFNYQLITKKINILKKIVGIKKKYELTLISNRAILIKTVD
jgi:surface carbohydrate biosynthesis protein